MNNTLVKGLQLLELLARADGPLGISELAKRLGMGKSNVHRLLQALVELRYVLKDGANGSYRVSIRLWELGSSLATRLDIKTPALESMNALLTSLRETVHLSVLDGDDVVYIHKLDSLEPVRAYSEIGGRAPAHCVATGKAILAWQPPARLDDLSRRLARHSVNTIVDPVQFMKTMEKVRVNGYAVNRGEWRESVWGVASPIRNAEGQVIGAIGVSGPSVRIKPTQIKRFANEVMAAADAVSAKVSRGTG